LTEILCDEHGQMEHDAMRCWWFCGECGRKLPDEDVHRLLMGAREPVPQIVVT
jgi:hypothetical protein